VDGYKLGRKPRVYNAGIPHLTTLNAGKTLPPPPASVDYTHSMPEAPDKFGFMLNNRLGDCTCAAFYHARQIWTFHSTGKTATASDTDVMLLYEKSCGYDLSDPNSDQGGVEQDVLTYVHQHGAPIGPDGSPYDKIASFAEVDCRRIDDIKRTIYTCGVAYIGFNVPQNILPPGGTPPHVWSVAPNAPPIVGGHAVVLPGYDADGAIVISWGRTFKMTWEFFTTYADEAYAITDKAWSLRR
jgi:hypothetical protein